MMKLGSLRNAMLLLTICAVFAAGCMRGNLRKSYNAYELGNDSFRKGDFIQAMNYYLKAKEFSKRDPDVDHMIGLTYLARHNFEGNANYLPDAAKNLEQAIKLYPGFTYPEDQDMGRLSLPEARVNLSSVYLAQDRYDDAIREAMLAAQDPLFRSPDKANYNLGAAYFKKRQHQKAINYLEISLRQNRQFAGGFKTLGEVYLDMKNYRQAIESLRAATEIFPKYAEAYYLMGTVYQKQNQRMAARDIFRKCYQADPKGEFGTRCKSFLR